MASPLGTPASATADNGPVKIPTEEELDSRSAQIRATIYGQCIGDCVGLLTEFLSKAEAKTNYKVKNLEYEMKISDFHRNGWVVGDWTDDSDQMFLILQSLLDNKGQVNVQDFAEKMRNWMLHGFPEFGDHAGCGIGATTQKTLHCGDFLKDPHTAAFRTWDKKGRNIAPNGGVMRTSVVGTHCWWDTQAVVKNALDFVMCTHHDPRCRASAVAVSVCISLMLQRRPQHLDKKKKYKVDLLIKDSFNAAAECLETGSDRKMLWKFMSCKKVKDLDLAESGKIGYTYKSMGSGFWALKQDDFRKAVQKITMEGGDADTNACVAGAMLGCKLGWEKIPESWKTGLVHREWLDQRVDRWLLLQKEMATQS